MVTAMHPVNLDELTWVKMEKASVMMKQKVYHKQKQYFFQCNHHFKDTTQITIFNTN